MQACNPPGESLKEVARALDGRITPPAISGVPLDHTADSAPTRRAVPRSLLWLTWLAFAFFVEFLLFESQKRHAAGFSATALVGVTIDLASGGFLYLITRWFVKDSRLHFFLCLLAATILWAVPRCIGGHMDPPTSTISSLPNASILSQDNQKLVRGAFVWKPTGSEYSVTFPDTPRISEKNGYGSGAPYLEAYHLGVLGFEQAQFFPITAHTPTNKEDVTAAILDWAGRSGLQHCQVEIHDSNHDDIVFKFSATKPAKEGDGTMSILGERHYGRRSAMITLIGDATANHPTPEGLALIRSIRQDK